MHKLLVGYRKKNSRRQVGHRAQPVSQIMQPKVNSAHCIGLEQLSKTKEVQLQCWETLEITNHKGFYACFD